MKRIRRIKIVRKTREAGFIFGKTARETVGESRSSVCPLCRHPLLPEVLRADEKSIAEKASVSGEDEHDCSETNL